MSFYAKSFGGATPEFSSTRLTGLADVNCAAPNAGDALVFDARVDRWAQKPSCVSPVKVSAVATAGDATYDAASLVGGLIERDCAGADRTDTTASAAALVAAVRSAAVGDSFRLVVSNVSAGLFTVTVAAGAGVTLVGSGAVAQDVTAEFLVVLKNVTAGAEAATVYAL